MNHKAIWAALAAVALGTGLQSQHLFPEEVQLIAGVSLILVGGVSIFRLFSLEEKKREAHERIILSMGQERNEEIRGFRKEMEEVYLREEETSSKMQERLMDGLKNLEESMKEMDVHVTGSVMDASERETERLKAHMTETVTQFQKAVDMQQQDTMKFLKDTLKAMENRNSKFEEAVWNALQNFEKQFQKGQEGVRSAIVSFTDEVSGFSSHTNEALMEQSEMMSEFTSDLEEELKTFTNNLTKSMGDTLEDLGLRNEEMIMEVRNLGTAYQRFEEMSEGMIQKMRTISEEDYALMKDIFKNENL